MNSNLFIFGDGDMAEIAHYYFSNHSDFEVKGFVVDNEFLDKEVFCGLFLFSYYYFI